MKREDALDYHSSGRPGKIAVVPTKPLNNQRDLALAYSPGVAVPCLEIKAAPDDVYKYTAKGNLVAVVTNGTAVLGLGNIGALAAKPVMEGKANLFKQFADLDVFDLEVGSASCSSQPSAESISKTFGRPTAFTSRRRCGRR
jgi:malate dehydrogenase (oxaloacetate-decarboxylating)(NADP+)